ncbi:MAG TPA: hypothetical protein VGY53_09940 [Isosphaeraceae bacterium]|nr:hypothetical protein [Isosphaeraceae bacterium]
MVVALAWASGALAAELQERVQPIPLGGALAGQSGEKGYGVYVPTRFGGTLTITVSDGIVEDLKGPDHNPRTNGGEVGTGQHGWYTFRVKGAKQPYTVTSTFVQVGQSRRMPWNFYYWPTKADSIHEPWGGGNGRVDTQRNPNSDDIQVVPFGAAIAPGKDIILAGPNGLLETPVATGDTSTWFPNQYDDLTFMGADGTMFQTPSPMLKYDQLFNTSARAWEAENSQNQDIQRWPGHCLGGAVASILLNEPVPAPGSGLTADELKALWAELGENQANHQIADFANEIPPGPPRPGYDACDRSVPRVHAMLERHIRGQQQALLGNLRAFPPRGTVSEVWNHGIGKYTAKYHAIPGRGERNVKLEVEIVANSGSCLNGNDDKPRIVTYEYSLVYGLDGEVDETNLNGVDWISVGGEALFAPLNILELAQSRWGGHNPMVNESNVRSVDMANGGGYRFAGVPPQFRPVGNYEAGRTRFAFGNRWGRNRGALGFPNDDAASPRRGGSGGGGLFGFLRGR